MQINILADILEITTVGSKIAQSSKIVDNLAVDLPQKAQEIKSAIVGYGLGEATAKQKYFCGEDILLLPAAFVVRKVCENHYILTERRHL